MYFPKVADETHGERGLTWELVGATHSPPPSPQPKGGAYENLSQPLFAPWIKRYWKLQGAGLSPSTWWQGSSPTVWPTGTFLKGQQPGKPRILTILIQLATQCFACPRPCLPHTLQRGGLCSDIYRELWWFLKHLAASKRQVCWLWFLRAWGEGSLWARPGRNRDTWKKMSWVCFPYEKLQIKDVQ